MIALALSTVFSAGFALLIRLAQGMGSNLVAVGAVNYLTATALNTALFLVGGPHMPHGTTVAIAVSGGFAYAAAFFIVFLLTRLRGASITAAVMRMSAVVPVAVSLLAWGERLTALQAAGAAAALASLPLLTLRPASGSAGIQRPAQGRGAAAGSTRAQGVLLLLGLFAVNGLCLLAPRAFRQTAVAGEEAAFLAILFATAAVTTSTVWTVCEHRVPRSAGAPTAARHPLALDLLPGIAVGACNALANRFVVAALQQLPATLVYPFYSAVGLVITVAVARLAWRERFAAAGAAGLCLACASVVLVNLG